MGRPSKLNEEIIKRFAEEVEDGLPIIYVCDLREISDTTYHNWMNQGKKDIDEGQVETLSAKFFGAIKKAYAQYVKNAKNEMRAKTNGWQSIAWWLERTNPFFMPKQQIQADEDGKVTVVIGGKPKNVNNK